MTDILEAIDNIQRHASRGRQSFDDDELLQVRVVHHTEISGEAARKLSSSVEARHTNIPCTKITAIRNILAHDYFRIDLDEVWRVVERDIPILKAAIEKLMKSYGEGPYTGS